MGSSVMGVSLMKKKVEEAGLDVTVEHISVKSLTDEPDMIVTTNALKARVEDTISKYDKQIPVFCAFAAVSLATPVAFDVPAAFSFNIEINSS